MAIEVVNPASGEVVDTYEEMRDADIRERISAAEKSYVYVN